MTTNLIVCTVTQFSGTTTPDKNGMEAVMLQCIAGKMPNRNVLAGTVAKRLGVEIGKTYLLQVREVGQDEFFGTDFNFIKIAELKTGEDILNTVTKLPEAEIMVVQRPEEFYKTYQRKGDIVVSARRERIKEGKYHSFFGDQTRNENAKHVRGTSLVSEPEIGASPAAFGAEPRK